MEKVKKKGADIPLPSANRKASPKLASKLEQELYDLQQKVLFGNLDIKEYEDTYGPKEIQAAKLLLNPPQSAQQKPPQNLPKKDDDGGDKPRDKSQPFTQEYLDNNRNGLREGNVRTFIKDIETADKKVKKDERLMPRFTEQLLRNFVGKKYKQTIEPEFFKDNDNIIALLLNTILLIGEEDEKTPLKFNEKPTFYKKSLNEIKDYVLQNTGTDAPSTDYPSAGVPLVASKGRKRMTAKELKQHLQSRKTIPKQTPYNLKQTIFDILKS